MNIQLNSYAAKLMASIVALAIVGIAPAQRRWDGDMNTTMEGRGTVHFDGITYSFRSLQLTVQKNKRVTVHAILDNPDGRDVVFMGKMSDIGRRTGRLSADLDSAAYGRESDAADALCDVDLGPDETFRTVTITGRNTSDHNVLSLDLVSNGHRVTTFQPPARDRIYDQDRNRRDQHDQNWGRDKDHDRGGPPDFPGRLGA